MTPLQKVTFDIAVPTLLPRRSGSLATSFESSDQLDIYLEDGIVYLETTNRKIGVCISHATMEFLPKAALLAALDVATPHPLIIEEVEIPPTKVSDGPQPKKTSSPRRPRAGSKKGKSRKVLKD